MHNKSLAHKVREPTSSVSFFVDTGITVFPSCQVVQDCSIQQQLLSVVPGINNQLSTSQVSSINYIKQLPVATNENQYARIVDSKSYL